MCYLVILLVDFKEGLRMVADGAGLRSLGADNDVAAVTAFPNLDFRFLKYLGGFNVLEQSTVTLLMTFLNCCHTTETCCKFRESLLLGSYGKALIHISPLIILTIGSSGKVLSSITYTLKFLEPEFGVLFLIVCCLLKYGSYLLKAVLFCS